MAALVRRIRSAVVGLKFLLKKSPVARSKFEYASDKFGAQVVALGEGQFDVHVLHGRLPGKDWKPSQMRSKLAGQRKDGIIEVEPAAVVVLATNAITVHRCLTFNAVSRVRQIEVIRDLG